MNEFFIQNSDFIVKLFLALLLGALIGTERLFVYKEAGMKTHSLIAMGATLFIIISETLTFKYAGFNNFDPARMASQIIVGIGFLGAGSIILQGSHIKGLTTASGFWVTAGIGMAVGFGLYSLAIIATFFILTIFIILSLIERPIKRFIEKKENQK